MSFAFSPARRPFPRWMGPFSPARGTHAGYRFSHRRFGTWLTDGYGREFWELVRTPGVAALESVVLGEWGGGRVLLLPNGYAVKPLQEQDEVGKRVLIGAWGGEVVLRNPGGGCLSMAAPPVSGPGAAWAGPDSTGLECHLDANSGELGCSWYHPTALGREEIRVPLRGRDPALAAGFRACRPGDNGGRVRVTANGHVTVKRQQFGAWSTLYVGYVGPDSWGDWKHWIGEGGT